MEADQNEAGTLCERRDWSMKLPVLSKIKNNTRLTSEDYPVKSKLSIKNSIFYKY